MGTCSEYICIDIQKVQKWFSLPQLLKVTLTSKNFLSIEGSAMSTALLKYDAVLRLNKSCPTLEVWSKSPYHVLYIAQCGNSRIFLLFRFLFEITFGKFLSLKKGNFDNFKGSDL